MKSVRHSVSGLPQRKGPRWLPQGPAGEPRLGSACLSPHSEHLDSLWQRINEVCFSPLLSKVSRSKARFVIALFFLNLRYVLGKSSSESTGGSLEEGNARFPLLLD